MKMDYTWKILVFGTLPFGILAAIVFFLLVEAALNRPIRLRQTAALANPDQTETVRVTPLYAYVVNYTGHGGKNSQFSSWRFKYGLAGRYSYHGKQYTDRLPFSYVVAQLSILPEFTAPLLKAASRESILKSAGNLSEWRIATSSHGWKVVPPGHTTSDDRLNNLLQRIDSAQAISETVPILTVKVLKNDPTVTDLKYWEITQGNEIMAMLFLAPFFLFFTFIFFRTLPFSTSKNWAIVALLLLLVAGSRPAAVRIIVLIGRAIDGISGRTEFQYKDSILRPLTEVERRGQ